MSNTNDQQIQSWPEFLADYIGMELGIPKDYIIIHENTVSIPMTDFWNLPEMNYFKDDFKKLAVEIDLIYAFQDYIFSNNYLSEFAVIYILK